MFIIQIIPCVINAVYDMLTLSSLCWFKQSSISPFFKYSLSVSSDRFPFFIKRFTSIKTFHHYLVNFLIPFHFSSHLMTAKKDLLDEEPFPKGLALFTPLFLKLCFDILLIWGLVDFRLRNHRYFYWDTISRWLPAKAKEWLICP